jgi:hypothetical protein
MDEDLADEDIMAQARSEPRKSFMCRITVEWEDETDGPQSQAGMLEDRSRSGAGISVFAPIPVGARVKVTGPRVDLSGTVRYCKGKNIRYLVGIQYDVVEKAKRTTSLPSI